MTFDNKPLISIIINCFNGSKYLKHTLESILNQTYTNFEVIFWDNRSTDNSKEIFNNIRDNRFKYFYAESHTVLYKARNLAIEKTSGDYIALIDSDDWWEKAKLEKQIKKFNEDNYALVYTNMNIVFQKESKFGPAFNYLISKILSRKYCDSSASEGYILTNLLYNYQVGLPSIIFKKAFFNGFNSNYQIIGDFDYVIRLSVENKIGYINECLTNYRIHGANESMLKRDIQFDEITNWYEEMKMNNEMNTLSEFKYFANKIAYTKAVNLLSFGKYKYALKIIVKTPISFWKYKLRLLILIIFPRIIIKIIRS